MYGLTFATQETESSLDKKQDFCFTKIFTIFFHSEAKEQKSIFLDRYSPNIILVSQPKSVFISQNSCDLYQSNSWHWRIISSTKHCISYKVAFSKIKMLNWKMAILLRLPYFWVISSVNINSATTYSLGNHLSKHSFSCYLWASTSQSCLFAIRLSSLDQTEVPGWFSVDSSTVSFMHTGPPFCLCRVSTARITP